MRKIEGEVMFISGVIGIYKNNLESLDILKERLSDYRSEIEKDDVRLLRVIKLDPILETIGELDFVKGVLIYEKLVTKPKLVVEKDVPVLQHEKVKETFYGRFHAAVDFIIADRLENAKVLFDVVSDAIGSEDFVRNAYIDIERIFKDFSPNTWLGGIEKRQSNVRSGLFYGDKIPEDPELGDVIVTSQKNQIGFIVDYKDARVKVRVTRGGFVQVYSNWSYAEFIEFIRDVLWPYIRKV